MKSNKKEQWNQFVIQNNGSFLQSYDWGEFQQSLGRQIWRLEVGELKALVIKHDLPFKKSYLYCPRGPILEIPNKSQIPNHKFQTFLREIKKIAGEENSIFFKIEPPLMNFEFRISNFEFIKSQKQIQPSQTIVLDISQSEEELLDRMHQKTRYNIRLAQRKGVTIQRTANNEQRTIETFLNLLEETAKRGKFRPHPKKYYQKMLDVLGKEGMMKLFLAKYQDQIIAANLVCFFGQTATYLHGASDYNFRQLMATHLLQWQAILEAKKADMKYYDFWGIDEKKWPGVTRFKKGFGGKEITYPDSFDLIFQPIWYRLYNLARKTL